MSTNTTVRRLRPFLKVKKEQIVLLIALAQLIHDKMVANQTLFSAPTVSMAVLAGQIADLSSAQQELKKRTITAAQRDLKRDALWTSLGSLLQYVQGLCDSAGEQAAAIISAAGMKASTFPTSTKPVLAAKRGTGSGEVGLRVRVPDDTRPSREAILRSLFTDYGDYLLGFFQRRGAQPASAEDLKAQVILILCEQFEGKRPLPAEIQPYMTGIARNLLKARARARRRGPVCEAELDEEMSPSTGPEGRAIRDERWEKLKRYLDALSEEEAEVFVAVRLEGKTVAQIAEARGQAWSTVNDQLQRAQEKVETMARASARAAELRARARRPR